MDPVRIAVIGAGLIGQRHIELISTNEACQLVGILDTDSNRKTIADHAEVPFSNNLGEILATQPDGVIVATPTPSHAEIAIACTERGIPSLIEKPIASSVEQGQRLVDTAAGNHVPILVGHHRRHHTLIQKARSVVRDGELGQLISVALHWMLKKPDKYFDVPWRTKPGGGPVLINLIHEVDTLRYICGEIDSIYATTSTNVRGHEVEDSACITLTFKSGALGSIVASDAAPSPWSYETTTFENPDYHHVHENCCFFFGSRRSLVFPTMEMWSYDNDEAAGWQHPLRKETLVVERNDPLIAQLRNFCQVIRREAKPLVSGKDGLATLAATLAILESAETNAPVKL